MREKWFVESGMAACGTASRFSARFPYRSMTTSNYRIHFAGIAEKVRPFINTCHLSFLESSWQNFGSRAVYEVYERRTATRAGD
jgi:hypothetical protein